MIVAQCHNVFIPESSALRPSALGAKQPNRLAGLRTPSMSARPSIASPACGSFSQQCTKEGHLQSIVVFIIYMLHSNKLFVTDAEQNFCFVVLSLT